MRIPLNYTRYSLIANVSSPNCQLFSAGLISCIRSDEFQFVIQLDAPARRFRQTDIAINGQRLVFEQVAEDGHQPICPRTHHQEFGAGTVRGRHTPNGTRRRLSRAE